MVQSNEFKGATLAEAVKNATAVWSRPRRLPYKNNGNPLRALRRLCLLLKALPAKASERFDFISRAEFGRTLFLGEGNLSFSLAIASKINTDPAGIITTTFEDESDISAAALENSKQLLRIGATVHYNVDATKLETYFNIFEPFDVIVFQFPNTASRKPIEGRNRNFILLRDFLKSAAPYLSPGGVVVVTIVNSEYYWSSFQPDEASKKAGYKAPAIYDFDPADYPIYNHTKTHQDADGLEAYNDFCTLVFEKT